MILPFTTFKSALRMAVALLALLLLLGGCANHYNRGLALEAKNRWEEAAIEFHLAVIDDPGDPEVRAALERANKVVARENFEHYRVYLARKQFHKAYLRLLDAARQDPEYAPVAEEMAKWMRVLISGRVVLNFDTPQGLVNLADEMSLVVMINTPNPGEIVEATIDIDSGIFFTENLLYDRTPELLTLYSLNSIGIKLRYGRSKIKKFTSSETRRFVTFRTPVMDSLEGKLVMEAEQPLRRIALHRESIPLNQVRLNGAGVEAINNPRYTLRLTGQEIEVMAANRQGVFSPRYLYLNRQDRRQLVDFGNYEIILPKSEKTWKIRRMPLGGDDYFTDFARNIALKPYFFYRDGVYTYREGSPSATGKAEGGKKRHPSG